MEKSNVVVSEEVMKQSTKEKADLLVEQVQQLASSSKLLHEKLDKTNEWHGQQNVVTMRIIIFIAICSLVTTIFLGLIYFNL